MCAYTDIPNFDLCDELFKNLCEKKPTPCIWLITPRPCIPGFPVRGPTHHVRVQHPAFYTSISTLFVFGGGKLSHLIRLISRRSWARGREEHRTGYRMSGSNLGACWSGGGPGNSSTGCIPGAGLPLSWFPCQAKSGDIRAAHFVQGGGLGGMGWAGFP